MMASIMSRHVDLPPDLSRRSVGEAMLRAPKLLVVGARVDEARTLFEDDHVHAALVVEADGRLCSVVLREDLEGRSASDDVAAVGRLEGRIVEVDADLETTRRSMAALGERRRAVVEPATGRLVGLLCLKRSGAGFCSDVGAAARAADRG
jgi:CBS domain-containing protein